MTVQITENWTDLEGEVQSVMPAPDVPNHVIVEIRVRQARAVKGFANLISAAAGTILRVHVANDVAKEKALTVGGHIHCRVRRGGPKRVFAHPSEIRAG